MVPLNKLACIRNCPRSHCPPGVLVYPMAFPHFLSFLKFSITYFGVRVSETFNLMCVHIIFSSDWVAKWPSFGTAKLGCKVGQISGMVYK